MGLRQDILNEPISSIELRPALTVVPSHPVRHAVEVMKQNHLGCVIILGADGSASGVFTEKNLTRLLLEHPDALDLPIGEHRDSAWASVRKTDPVAKLIDTMQTHKLRFVVVVDEHNRPVGLTGQKGAMEYIVDHFPRQVKVQLMESKLYMDQREGG